MGRLQDKVAIVTGAAIATSIAAADPETVRANIARIHPIGRSGEPVDIANAALWLASDESTLVTGQAIVVDGGWIGADRRCDEMNQADWTKV